DSASVRSSDRPSFAREPTMEQRVSMLLVGAAPLLAALLIAPCARAELESCGGIFLSSDASCQFHKSQDCVETCKTVSVQESCAAQLYTKCESSCTADASTTCSEHCSPVCVSQCMTAAQPESSDDICKSDCIDDC